MTENLSSKFAQLSVRSEDIYENIPEGFVRVNGDEDKGVKGNPWKPIPSFENNSLEAEAWPEPSVPTEQRRLGTSRLLEEKPKRKVVWHNYEVDDSARGRGRNSSSGFSGSGYAAGPGVRPFRRGYGGYRNRPAADANRGRSSNGFYPRHPGRVAHVRPVVGQRDQPAPESCQKLNSSPTHVTTQTYSSSGEGTDSNSDNAKQDKTAVSDGVVVEARETIVKSISHPSDIETANRNSVSANQSGSTPRKSYRERAGNSQLINSASSVSSSYDAGPVGRARRSYQRQHQPMYASDVEAHSLAAHSALVANPPIQPILPFQTLPQIAYVIPGTPSALLNATLQLTQTPTSPVFSGNIPAVTLSNPSVLPTQPTVQHSVVGLPHLSVESLPISILPDVSTVQQVSHGFTHQPTLIPTATFQTPDIPVETVDVNQMIAYLNEVGWKKVNFPVSLRDNPAVAAALREALGHSNFDLIDGQESVSKTDTPFSSTQSRNEETGSKPDDVVIVEDRVFFVPRNVNRTKFLKFVSKLDYIRHHIEYYFSESNLQRDSHLFSILAANQDVCPLSDLLQFNRLRWVSTTESELLEAVSHSHLLVVVFSDGSPVGITRFVTLAKVNDNSSPSVVEFGFPRTTNQTFGTPTTISNSELVPNPTQTSFSNPSLITTGTSSSSHSTSYSVQPSLSSQVSSTSSASNSYVTLPVSTQVINSSAQSLPSIPQSQLPSYVNSPAYILNPGNVGILTNTGSANVLYPTSSQPTVSTVTAVSPFYPSDLTNPVNLRPTQSASFSSQVYSQQQAVALMAAAAAANQSGILTQGAGNANLAAADPTTASFMAALYRYATPGNPTPIVGAYLPSVASPVGIGTPPNSALFLQFIPGSHPTQPGAYFAPGSISYPPSTAQLLNRPVVPANPSGMWLHATGNVSNPHHFQPYVAFPHGHGNLSLSNTSASNGTMYSVTSPPTLPAIFGTVPSVNIGSDITGYGTTKNFVHTHSRSNPHTYSHQSPISSSASEASVTSAGTTVTSSLSSSNHSSASQVVVGHNSIPSTLPTVPVVNQQTSNAIHKRQPTNSQP